MLKKKKTTKLYNWLKDDKAEVLSKKHMMKKKQYQ